MIQTQHLIVMKEKVIEKNQERLLLKKLKNFNNKN